MEYYFYQLGYRDSKVPKCFIGLIQMQCSPFWLQPKANKTIPLHVGNSYTHALQQGKCLSYPPDCIGGVTESPKCMGSKGAQPPCNPHWQEGTTLLKFPSCSTFRGKGGQKTINVFSHFHGLIPNTNYKHLECFIMLGTHSKLCRGQMSHICDISPLRVKIVFITLV